MARTKKRHIEVAAPTVESSSEDEDPYTQPAVYPRTSFGGGKQLRPMGGGKQIMRDDSDDDESEDEEPEENQPSQVVYHNRSGGGKVFRPSMGGKQIRRYPQQELSEDENSGNSDSEAESEVEAEKPAPVVYPPRGGGKILRRPPPPGDDDDDSSSDDDDDDVEEEEPTKPQPMIYSGGRTGGKSLVRPPVYDDDDDDDDEEEEETPKPQPMIYPGGRAGGKRLIRPPVDVDSDDDEEEEDDVAEEEEEDNAMQIDDSDSEVDPKAAKKAVDEKVEDESDDMELSSGEESSSDEDLSEDEKELDFETLDQNQLIEGEADQKYLDSLPEVERESILAERFEKLKNAEDMKKALRENKRRERERRRLAGEKKPSKKKTATKSKAETEAKEVDEKEKDDNEPDTTNDQKIAADLGLSRTAKNRDVTGVKAKKQRALDKLRQDRLDSSKNVEKEADSDLDYGVSEDDDDDSEADEYYKPWEATKKKASRLTQMDEDSDEGDDDAKWRSNKKTFVEADLSDFTMVTVPRRRLIRWCNEPFFEKSVKGFYVRLAIGREQRTQKACYRLCKIMGVKTGKQYEFPQPANTSQRPVTTNKWLTLKFAESSKEFKMMMISDAKPTEDDVKMCLNQMKNRRGGARSILSKKDAKKMRKVQDHLVNNYTYTVEDIQKSIEEKKNLSNKISNLAAEKTKSEIAVKAAAEQLNEAKKHQVELERKLLEVDAMDEERVQDDIDIAKSRVEELDDELKKNKSIQRTIIEAEATRQRRMGKNLKMTSVARVNNRAKIANKAADTEAYKFESEKQSGLVKDGDNSSLYRRRKKSIKCLWEVGQDKETEEDDLDVNPKAAVAEVDARKGQTFSQSKEEKERRKAERAKLNQINDSTIELDAIMLGISGTKKAPTKRIRRGISIEEYRKRKKLGTQ